MSRTPPGAPTSDSFNLFVWDVYGTWTPRDWMRWDFGNSRQPMQIPQPTFRNISVVTTNFGLDWRLSPRWLTAGQMLYSTYSDSNARFYAL